MQPFETIRVDKAGRRLQMSITASPIKDSQGRIIGASKIGRDITLRTRREQMNRFLSESSAALADLSDYESTLRKLAHLAVPGFADLCAVDIQRDDGSVHRLALIQSNSALDALTEEILQTHPPLPTDQYGAMRVLRSGESVWYRVVSDDFLKESAQSERHLDWLRQLRPRSYMCVPVRSQRSAVGALTFVTTESGREYDETDLRVAEDLAHRAAIAIENATLVSTLKEADRRKDEFLAMLAHELRNPLAPIRNAAHIVRARAPQTPELTWATQVIERQVHQMTRLVDDLLDVSRITSGKIRLHPERITMESVIDDVVETSQPQIEQPWSPARGPEARRTDLRERGPGAPGADPVQPARQRGQVHRARRADLAGADGGYRMGRGPGQRHRRRDREGDADTHLRDVHAAGPVTGPDAGRAGDRADAGAEAGGDARGDGVRAERGSGAWE